MGNPCGNQRADGDTLNLATVTLQAAYQMQIPHGGMAMGQALNAWAHNLVIEDINRPTQTMGQYLQRGETRLLLNRDTPDEHGKNQLTYRVVGISFTRSGVYLVSVGPPPSTFKYVIVKSEYSGVFNDGH